MDLKQWFAAEWQQQVEERQQNTTYPPETWRASGRASKANPNKEDPAWWHEHGPGFVQTWVNWRDSVGWPIWQHVEGEPAIELDITVEHPHGWPITMRSVTDRVMVNQDGMLVVVDIKSGTYKPPAPLQLAINAECINLFYGIRPKYGVFFDARKGGFDTLHDLDLYPSEFLWDRAWKAKMIRDNQLFAANPSNLCSSCSVREFCHTMLGARRHEFPPHQLGVVQ